MTIIDPYNPLDLQALGLSLISEFERRSSEPLDSMDKFVGSGIYAIYYVGSALPYAPIGEYNRKNDCVLPIYIGKAAAPAPGKGTDPFEEITEPLLWSRINEHRNSIKKTKNLRIQDFCAKALVCMPIWVPLAEAVAIRRYQPLWNSSVRGFGIHGPGGGRAGQMRSQWDELHPGRSHATKLKQNAKAAVLLVEVHDAAKAAVSAHSQLMMHRMGLLKPTRSAPTQPPPQPVALEPHSRSAASPRPRRR